MAGTGTLGVIQCGIHKQTKDEGGFSAFRGDLTMALTQLNAAAQDFILYGNQRRDGSRSPSRRNDRVGSIDLNAQRTCMPGATPPRS